LHAHPVARRAVLVGWSSGDWRIVSPLLDAGRLPHLAGIVADGVCGQLASLWPDLPPLLWTSLTTGKRPQRHGILGFEEPDGEGGVRPITTRDRIASPLWTIASRAGLVSLAIDAGPTFPADPIDGVVVSNRFVAGLGRRGLDPAGLVPPGLVHPADRAANLVRSWVAGSVVPDDLLGRFLADVETAQVNPAAVDVVRSAIADTLGVAALVRELAAGDWSLAVVRYALVDRLAEQFLMFHPPRGPGVLEDAFRAYREVITAAHVLLDRLLGELVAAAGPETCVAVVSDRGLNWLHLRTPGGRGDRPRATPFGLLAMAGPGIRRDERISGASILDICPTLLHVLGLPRAADMDGHVLTDAFEPQHPLGAGSRPEIASWDHPPEASLATGTAGGAIERIQALTRARCLLAAGEAAAAEPALRGLVETNPADVESAIELAECLRALGQPLKAVELLRQLSATLPVGTGEVLAVPLATALTEAGLVAEAVERLRSGLAAHGPRIDLFVGIAQAEASRDRFADAAEACRRILEIDDQHRPALVILASALYRLRRYDEATQAARQAVSLGHFDPPTHLLLGTTLAACGRAAEAIAALETACGQDPALAEARERLAAVHARQRGDFAAAHASRRRVREADESVAPGMATTGTGRVVVVSGLPRAGTSLVMQMLAAGGIPPLTDAIRGADEHNPLGYLEFEAVKRIARDRSWIRQASGRAVKVIASLLPELPPGHDYRVILVHRDLQEVLASQRAMLRSSGAAPAAADDQLLRAFERHLENARQWCATSGVPLLEVEHRTCLTETASAAIRMAAFLGDRLDLAAMTAAVNVSLWRNRPAAGTKG
jgi:predicted AlkP superfamily phosphohydrolase/phosphomutase/tetratricopeptide (TPR) repeat protein